MELEAQFEPNGGGGGGAVDSVNGQTGAVVLDAGDLEYDDEETYSAGSVGAELTSLKGDLNGKIDAPSNPSTNDFLVFNGSAWTAQSLSTWQGGSY